MDVDCTLLHLDHPLHRAARLNPATSDEMDVSPRPSPPQILPTPAPDVQSVELVSLIRAVCSAQYPGPNHEAILHWICAMVDSRPDCRINVELCGVSPSLAMLLGRAIGWTSEEAEGFFAVNQKYIKAHQKRGVNLMDKPALAAISIMRLIHCVNTMDVFRKRLGPDDLTPLAWLGQWILYRREGKTFAPSTYLQFPTGFTMALPWFKEDAFDYPELKGRVMEVSA